MADEDAYVEALTAPSDLRRAIDERDEARAEARKLDALVFQHREALERIAEADVFDYGFACAQRIALDALGGADE